MDDQTSMNGSQAQDHGNNGVVGNLAGFANDVATLAELQAKLVAMDLKESTKLATVPLGIAVAGAITAIGCIPVVLGGLSLLLAEAFKLSMGLSLVIVGGAVMILAGVAVAIATSRLSHSFGVFRRSREEFDRNLLWLKTVLTQSGRAVPRRRF